MADGKKSGSDAGLPQVPGYFVLPKENNIIDMGRLFGANAALISRGVDGIQVSTITGGVPDASDQLPEGTIIITS